MSKKFAHSERRDNRNVRCQRDDISPQISQGANMAGQEWYLKAWRTHRGLTLQALAELAGTSRGYISDLESGKRPIPPGTTLEKLATALDVDARQLVAEDPAGTKPRPRTVPLVGYVGAGSQAHFYAGADDPGEQVEAPVDASDATVAAEVRGTSLGPAFDRWLVFYDDVRSPVTPDLYGELCVVGTDDQVLVKILRPAGTPHRFHLISNGSEEPIFDREVLWAAKVTTMRRR
jgi:transcriptional regulator with XRE-family HTH domain